MCLLGGTNQRELDLLFKISMWPLIGDGLFELWKLPPRKEKIKNLITSVGSYTQEFLESCFVLLTDLVKCSIYIVVIPFKLSFSKWDWMDVYFKRTPVYGRKCWAVDE
jgi:hypothetical protein